MCGIVGMAGKLQFQHRAIFKDMLAVCQVRGRDSTGVIRVKPDDEYVWVKNVGTPDFLLDTKMYDKQIDTGESKVLIGHCRAKTVGEVNTKNAHPFDFPGKICGVHNGTLKATYQMERGRDFTVDSELLYWTISEYGVEETITKRVDDGGAWALVYWNAEENTLNFLRNEERPLWFTHSEDKQVMFWASEPWMLSVVNRKLKLWDGEGNASIYPLPINQLYSFTIDHSKNKANEIFSMSSPKEVKAEVRGYAGNVHYSRGWTGEIGGTNRTNTTTTGSGNGGQVADPFKLDTDKLDDSLSGIGGKLLDNAENEGKVLRLPRPDTTRTPDGSTRTTSSTDSSSNSSRTGSASLTGLRSTTSMHRPRLSLPERSSSGTLLGPNGKPLSECSGHSTSCDVQLKPAKLSSLRQVAGMRFITDNKTGREFSEHDFDEETGGYCCFCRAPIGGLEEVQEIFCSSTKHVDEEIFFICTSCVVPAVA